MRVEENTAFLNANENQIYQLLIEGRNQSDVALAMSFTRAYINQIVKKLVSFELLTPIKANKEPGTKRDYVHRYQSTNKEIIVIGDPNPKKENPLPPLEKAQLKANSTHQRCLYCKKKITSKTHKYQKYCSRYCRGKHQSGPRSSQWKGGKVYEPYCYKFNEDLKERVRDFFDRECFMCGAGEIEKSHAVHHIEYNKMACCDGNNEAQLVPLCERCHNKTNQLNDRSFWERILYHQLMQRTGGKCFLSHKEILIIEQKQKREAQK